MGRVCCLVLVSEKKRGEPPAKERDASKIGASVFVACGGRGLVSLHENETKAYGPITGR